MKKQLLVLLLSTLILILFTGCGGGTDSAVPSINQGDTAETPEIPENTGSTEGGTFTLTLNVPGSSISSESISGSVVPWTGKTLRVTITGEFITSPIAETAEIAGGDTCSVTINNVPTGSNIAEIEVLDTDSNVVAQRKYGFFMYPGAVIAAGPISLGVAIDENGYANPSQIDIPVGTTLYFENRDFVNDRTVELTESGSGTVVTVGPVGKAESSSGSVNPEVYHAESYTFDSAGTYVYTNGLGGDGSDSYRLLVYSPPTLTGLWMEMGIVVILMEVLLM